MTRALALSTFFPRQPHPRTRTTGELVPVTGSEVEHVTPEK